MNIKYSGIWYALVDIKAAKEFLFNDLVDSDQPFGNQNYDGAWANVLIKAATIQEAIEIVPFGFKELGFEINKFDKIENFQTLVEESSINKEVINEADWLLDSKYIFKISEEIYPYLDE